MELNFGEVMLIKENKILTGTFYNRKPHLHVMVPTKPALENDEAEKGRGTHSAEHQKPAVASTLQQAPSVLFNAQ